MKRLAPDDQLASEDRLERVSDDLGAEPGGDVLGGGIGLLGRQAALLDGEVGAVAGRVDVARSSTRPYSSTGMKPCGSYGRPEMRRPSMVGSETMMPLSGRPCGREIGSRCRPVGPHVGSVSIEIRLAAESSPTAWLRRAPKTASGACSGVTNSQSQRRRGRAPRCGVETAAPAHRAAATSSSPGGTTRVSVLAWRVDGAANQLVDRQVASVAPERLDALVRGARGAADADDQAGRNRADRSWRGQLVFIGSDVLERALDRSSTPISASAGASSCRSAGCP